MFERIPKPMTMPTNAECRLCISELLKLPCLPDFERDFVVANADTTEFSHDQKQACHTLMMRYEITG